MIGKRDTQPKLLTALLLVASLCLTAAAQTDILPVERISAGMKGIVKTTLHGTEVLEVESEVLGVMKNALGPNTHLVVVRLNGPEVREVGVANGMSGSPFYIDGKLVGALAYSLGAFAKEPIAGVTPIGSMLAIQFGGKGQPKATLDYNRLFSTDPVVRGLAARLGRELHEGTSTTASLEAPAGLLPLAVQLSHSGMAVETIDKFGPLLAERGFELSAASTVGGSAAIEQTELAPGMPVFVELIGGDMTFGASGTVTHVEGKRVWAFGHPFYQLGTVDLPMVRAEVIKVYPSMEISYHITNVGEIIGSITQDRATGILGELGRLPNTIPLSTEIKHAGDTVATYTYRIARDDLFAPALIDIAISQSVLATQRQFGAMSVSLEGTINIKEHDNIAFNELYSGYNIGMAAGQLPAAIYQFLNANEFEPLTVESIDIKIDFAEFERTATLERAWFTKTEAKPGDEFKLIIELKPRRGRKFTLEQEYHIPPNLPDGVYMVAVGNGAAISRNENELVEGELKLRDVNHMIRLINSLRPSNNIYAQVYREEEGFYYDGDFFPDLPPSALSVMRENRAEDNLIRLKGTVIDERRMDTEYLVRGMKKLQFKIKH